VVEREEAGGMVQHESNDLIEQLSLREPIFHRREFGTTRDDLERMIDHGFWEIGASGSVYGRDYVIETVLQRYSDGPEPHDWPCRDFTLTVLAEKLFLLSYVLEQPQRTTRRSTIWRLSDDGWKIVFHQGTLMNVST
jgi:hypothetical protein